MRDRPPEQNPLRLLSIVIPTRDEEHEIAPTVEHLYLEMRLHQIPHAIVIIDDGSREHTWDVHSDLEQRVPTVRPVRNSGENGYGRAVRMGFEHATGDGIVILMADQSDDCRDVVRYWALLNEGWEAVFGSRF